MKITDAIKERIAESLASWVENDLLMLLDDQDDELPADVVTAIENAYRGVYRIREEFDELERIVDTLYGKTTF